MKRVLSVLCAVALLLTAFSVIPMGSMAAGKGDFNNDGKINSTDARQALLMTLQNGTPTQEQIWWCDYNQDGRVQMTDVRRVLLASVCGADTNYTTPTTTDCWGEKSVALLGDSISFGAGSTGELATVSYAGIVKNAFNADNGSTNYGFMPAYTTNWNPRSDEICSWPTMTGGPGVEGNASGWSETDNGNRLMTFGLTAYQLYASLTYKLRSGYSYDYVCVYYQTGPGYGAFSVANNTSAGGEDKWDSNGVQIFDCENTVEETKRTGFFEVSEFPNGISINIVSSDNSPVTITGLGFYNDISGNAVTFNKYTRGGAMLTPLSDKVLSQAASAGTLIMGLGYNDFFWGNAYGYTKEDFSDRIDYLIQEVNKNGTKLIVNDYLWSNYQTLTTYQGYSAAVKADVDEKYVFFREELKRLAAETGGIYINQEDYHGSANILQYVNANDGVHPVNTGHAMMAQPILEALGLD